VNATSIPKASPVAIPGLAAFLEPPMTIFRRLSSQESFERYCTGLLTDLPRKTCDGITSTVTGTATELLSINWHVVCRGLPVPKPA